MPPPLEELEEGGPWPWASPDEEEPATSGHDTWSESELGEVGVVPGVVEDSEEVDETWMPITPPASHSVKPPRLTNPSFVHNGDALFDEAGVYVGAYINSSTNLELPHSISVQLPSSTLVNPRSAYADFDIKAAEEVGEWKAVKSLLEVSNPTPDDDFIEFELDQFAIYAHSTGDHIKPYDEQRYPYEMKPLQHLSIKDRGGCTVLYVDGYLSYGDSRYFVRKMAFDSLPIGNYGKLEHTVGDQIWIQSRFNDKGENGVYYKLKHPAPEYARYHDGFLWIADLAKHVVDYMGEMCEAQNPVQFWYFESLFYKWLIRRHGEKQDFRRWFQKYNRRDFRIAVHANQDFIYKEANGVLGHNDSRYHPFWSEIRDFTAYETSGSTRSDRGKSSSGNSELEYRPNCTDSTQIPPTVVTPYTYDCFSHLPFASMMQKTEPSTKAQDLRQALIAKQHLEPPSKLHGAPKHVAAEALAGIDQGNIIGVGDVISTHHDDEDGHWHRQEVSGADDVDRWFGLVQKVHTSKTGTRSFDVIWIYRPADTICGAMKYPWNNELFLSDHCSCGDGMSKIKESEVLGIHDIHWGGSSTTDAEFFCRQTYVSEERRWITYDESHRICSHQKAAKPPAYLQGDTLLALQDPRTQTLEPCVLLKLNLRYHTAQVLFLPRRQQLEPTKTFRPNELVYCQGDAIEINTIRIYGKCIVRHFRDDEEILTPYDRDGVGNAFFIRTQAVTTGDSVRCLPFDPAFPFPPGIRQGFDPRKSFRKLRGFDLFCGGGNFGRGLEEAGAIEMNWANDINKRAIHTYMANLDGDQKNKVHPFVGSIDDLQRRALQGDFSDNVPRIGHVDFVSGGSPCPGFSRLTVDKTTPEQRKNQSLVASFASFIDLYRPKYGLLENVVEIVQTKKSRSEDVFCQLICAIVGLGYQAHFFLLDAWTYGSPQSRSRVFLAFAAPGYSLPQMPQQSHSHLPADQRTKSLGWLPNGEPMVRREFPPTPFAPVTARDAVADLPDIGDGKPDYCIPFPDHRQCYGVTRSCRLQFSLIPIQPYGMNFAKAYYNAGVITESERDAFPKASRRTEKTSRGWGRVHPRKIMSTVTTSPAPTDAFVGAVMHWNQPRILSVMEVRRAQGFRDHEVILGEPRSQWATIGNSVAREVSLALGLSFREAWLGSLINYDENRRPTSLQAVAQPAQGIFKPARAISQRTTVVDLTQDDRDEVDELQELLRPPEIASHGPLRQQGTNLVNGRADHTAVGKAHIPANGSRSSTLTPGDESRQHSQSTQGTSAMKGKESGSMSSRKRPYSVFSSRTTTTTVSVQMVSTTTTQDTQTSHKRIRTESWVDF